MPVNSEIQIEAARRAMNLSGLSAAERKAAQGRIEAELVAEAEAHQTAQVQAQIAAEAVQERARIAGVLKLGTDRGCPAQALRLSLVTPIEANEAGAVLFTMGQDRSAAANALALPEAAGSFGTPAAQAERQRVHEILAHPEAEGRTATARALALSTSLDLAAAVAALVAVPKVAAAALADGDEHPLAARSREAGDFGADPFSARPMSKEERSANLWKEATKGEGLFYG